MSRVLLQYLLPLLLPTIIYVTWSMIARRTTGGTSALARLRDGPWLWLVLVGVLLMGIVLTTVALTSGMGTEGTYIAPRWEDGRIIPGHIEPK